MTKNSKKHKDLATIKEESEVSLSQKPKESTNKLFTSRVLIFVSAMLVGVCVQQAQKYYYEQDARVGSSENDAKINTEIVKLTKRIDEIENERFQLEEQFRSLIQSEKSILEKEFKAELATKKNVDAVEISLKEHRLSTESILSGLKRELNEFVRDIQVKIEKISSKQEQNDNRFNDIVKNQNSKQIEKGNLEKIEQKEIIEQQNELERVRRRERDAQEKREREENELKNRQSRERELKERRDREEKEQKEKRNSEESDRKENEEKEKRKIDKERKKQSNDDIPNEVKNFKSVQISELKPKKMWIPIPNSNGGHRRVPQVEIRAGREHKSSVKVWLYEEFLSEEECDQLLKAHESHVLELKKHKPIICFDSVSTLRRYLLELNHEKESKLVTPNDFTEGTMCLNETFSRSLEKWGLKWSTSTSFYLGESKFSRIYSRRIEEATQLNETHGGKFQITSYPFGIGYRAHHDCLLDSNEQRDRYATFLVYLNDLGATGGGETNFTDIRIDVKPRKGRALVWNNMNYKTGKCESESIHEANPVKVETSKKYIIQRWYYYKSFYSLGKRHQEPQLPLRKPGQPRVSCDQYDFGSCRLYDEWNYDHLLEYRNQNNMLY